MLFLINFQKHLTNYTERCLLQQVNEHNTELVNSLLQSLRIPHMIRTDARTGFYTTVQHPFTYSTQILIQGRSYKFYVLYHKPLGAFFPVRLARQIWEGCMHTICTIISVSLSILLWFLVSHYFCGWEYFTLNSISNCEYFSWFRFSFEYSPLSLKNWYLYQTVWLFLNPLHGRKEDSIGKSSPVHLTHIYSFSTTGPHF